MKTGIYRHYKERKLRVRFAIDFIDPVVFRGNTNHVRFMLVEEREYKTVEVK